MNSMLPNSILPSGEMVNFMLYLTIIFFKEGEELEDRSKFRSIAGVGQ